MIAVIWGGYGVRDSTTAFDVYSGIISYNPRHEGDENLSEIIVDGWKFK